MTIIMAGMRGGGYRKLSIKRSTPRASKSSRLRLETGKARHSDFLEEFPPKKVKAGGLCFEEPVRPEVFQEVTLDRRASEKRLATVRRRCSPTGASAGHRSQRVRP